MYGNNNANMCIFMCNYKITFNMMDLGYWLYPKLLFLYMHFDSISVESYSI